MSSTEFKDPGTIGKPGPIGRVVRVLGGIFYFYFLYMTIKGYNGIVSPNFPASFSLWLGVLFCLYAIPHVLNIGLGFNWGKWPRWMYLVLGFGVVVFTYVQYGTLWGPEIGVLVFGLLFFVLITLAPAMVLSGIGATPG